MQQEIWKGTRENGYFATSRDYRKVMVTKETIYRSTKRILKHISQKAEILEHCYGEAKRLFNLLIATAKIIRQKLEGTPFSEFHKKRNKAKQDNNKRHQQIKSKFQSQMECARQSFANSLKRIDDTINDLLMSVGWSGLDFEHDLWHHYKPIKTGVGNIPVLTRIGELTANGKVETIKIPALVPIIGRQHVFIKAEGTSKDAAAESMQCIMLRLLAALPPTKVRFLPSGTRYATRNI